MRQRSPGSWELRVFLGVDPETRRRRYRSMTVRANRADADRQLAEMVAAARAVRDVGVRSSMSELLEAWFATASTSWAPTTIRQTRSVIDRYLHRRNLDLEAGRVSFTAGWVEGPTGPVLAATKTKRRHAVDLDAASLEVLVAHAHRCRTTNGGRLNPDGFVFSDDPAGASAWKPNRATKAFLRARRDAGLRDFRLHDLRHFMATHMLDAGIALPVVSRRLDHRRRSTTLDRYAHAVPGRDAEAAETLRRIVERAG